jgi:hypothetical protein
MWDDRHYRLTSKPDFADGIRVYARALSGSRSSSDNVLDQHVAQIGIWPTSLERDINHVTVGTQVRKRKWTLVGPFLG